MSTSEGLRAWVEVRGGAIRRNLERIRQAAGTEVPVIPMVKADGYGLGMEDVVDCVDPLTPWAYGVATIAEGLRLRDHGVQRPVLVLTPAIPERYGDAVAAGLTLSLSDLEAVERLDRAAEAAERDVDFHVEIDTGMGRAGFAWQDASAWGEGVVARAGPRLNWQGCFTHFHSADSDDASTREQWERLAAALSKVSAIPTSCMVHVCNSGGALRGPEFAADAVRPGIFLYGGRVGSGLPDPEPVASVRARVTFVRDANPGTTVGYGTTYTAGREERWATLGMGYGDGLPRSLGNCGHALLGGVRVPIIGRISMDTTVVDITGIEKVSVGDVATLIGRDGDATILLDEVAGQAGTIGYEILTGLTSRLPRIWIDDEGS